MSRHQRALPPLLALLTVASAVAWAIARLLA